MITTMKTVKGQEKIQKGIQGQDLDDRPIQDHLVRIQENSDTNHQRTEKVGHLFNVLDGISIIREEIGDVVVVDVVMEIVVLEEIQLAAKMPKVIGIKSLERLRIVVEVGIEQVEIQID